MILVQVESVWYRTRALSHVTLHYDLKQIATKIYDSDRDLWVKCNNKYYNKELFKLDGWLRNFEQFEFINTKKVVSDFYTYEY